MFIQELVLAYIAGMGFGILIQVPRRTLFWGGFGASIAWIVTKTATPQFGVAGATFIGAYFACLYAYLCAHYLKAPVSCFNVTAVFVLVPGIMLYNSIRALIGGDFMLGLETLMRTFITTFAISGALMASDITYKYVKRSVSKVL